MSCSLKISGHDPSEHVFCARYSENICSRVNASRPLRCQLEWDAATSCAKWIFHGHILTNRHAGSSKARVPSGRNSMTTDGTTLAKRIVNYEGRVSRPPSPVWLESTAKTKHTEVYVKGYWLVKRRCLLKEHSRWRNPRQTVCRVVHMSCMLQWRQCWLDSTRSIWSFRTRTTTIEYR